MYLGVGTCFDFGGGDCEGREVEREELEVSENLDRRRTLLQHQASNTSSIKPPMLTPMMMPPAWSRRMPVFIVVVVVVVVVAAAAASALRTTPRPVALFFRESGTVIVTHAAVVDVVIVAEFRSGTTWVSTPSSSCIGRPSKMRRAGILCKITQAMNFDVALDVSSDTSAIFRSGAIQYKIEKLTSTKPAQVAWKYKLTI
jgi:hypothetical protein